MKQIDFYLDFISPYAYLAFEHLPEVIKRPFAMSFLTTALGPSPELFKQGAILVDANGERFVEETERPGYAVPRRPGRIAYIVMDAKIAAKFSAWPYFISTAPGVAYAYLADYRRNRRDIYRTGATVEALASNMRMAPERLRKTIDVYNADSRLARKGGEAFPPLDDSPFVALGPVKSYVVFTDGGLKVSTSLDVLDGDGRPIPGLYASGSNGQGGVLLEGHGHHLAWAFISGRIAGANAARDNNIG